MGERQSGWIKTIGFWNKFALYVMPVVRRVMLQSEFDQDETRVMLQQMPDSFSCLAPNVLKE
ncbi:hypothetical protein DPMN_187977 [Dreissena polymorpha]|uniref:Uncharacterized protein n=1 Tax=Dreissena polymorpha TaxID=45954 RepID=A0A9D4IAX6_DREPO|nr:hypothetical protein DPMN_187977 [Dreissena polymorpha]